MSVGKRALVGLIALGVLVAIFPMSAQAQSEEARPRIEVAEGDRPASIDRAKARVIAQIEQRLQALDRLTQKVANARFVTDEHEASLLADYATARRALTSGLDTVAAVETLEELREVVPPIFESTLVKALLWPKTKAVVASDSIAGISGHFERIGERLSDALDRLAANGVAVSEAESDLAEAERLVADAVATGMPVADRVIDLQPGDEFREPLAEAKAALQSSRRLLGEARASIGEVIRFIRSTMGNQDRES
ncbi:MAG: hypothetical protein QNJ75_05465 [Acidimicrobiia bacterium]|nr:hypothetical protein [Acidimicrobiia bacterium]